ncbi:MAG: response regulator transcription factor [Nocardioidaceae bacterium]
MTPSTPAVRVLLVDDHRLFTQSLCVALSHEGLRPEIADLTDRERLIGTVSADPPRLALVDLDLGGAIGDGVTLVAPFTRVGVRVLVVSATTVGSWTGTAIEQGAIGVVPKCAPFEELLDVVERAGRGEEVRSKAERLRIIANLRTERAERKGIRQPFDRLTQREQQVLRALGSGKTVGHIADEWVVSEATVRSQVRGVLTKLDVNSQLEAVARALRAGWLTASG